MIEQVTEKPSTREPAGVEVNGLTPPPLGVAAAEPDAEEIELDSFEPVSEPVAKAAPAADSDSSGARAFAIADVIRLLRSLPAAPRVDMVVRLVRVTLGAVNVSVEEVSEVIGRREKVLQGRIGVAQAQVDELEKQLQAKRGALVGQQGELKQLESVRERLLLAMNPAPHRPPPIPRDAIKRSAFDQSVPPGSQDRTG